MTKLSEQSVTVAEILLSLGYSKTDVAKALDLPPRTQLLDRIVATHGQAKCSAEENYRERLKWYCAHVWGRKEGAVAIVYFFLYRKLSIYEHEFYLQGLLDMAQRLTSPHRLPMNSGYWNLVNVIWQRKRGRPALHREDPSDYWMGLDKSGHYPKKDELHEHMQLYVDNAVRTKMIGPWPENGNELLDSVIATAFAGNPRKGEILRQRFGLGTESQTLVSTAALHSITPERVRQIEWKAIRELSQGGAWETIRSNFLRMMGTTVPANEEGSQS